MPYATPIERMAKGQGLVQGLTIGRIQRTQESLDEKEEATETLRFLPLDGLRLMRDQWQSRLRERN